jgi:hypothetical protein
MRMSLLDLDITDLSPDELAGLADSPLAEVLSKTDSESNHMGFSSHL